MGFFDQYIPKEKKFKFPSSQIGAPTSPMTPKQLDEFGKRLNTGLKNVEVGTLQIDKFESIPKQHFEEIRRLSKLTKSNVSLHGPLIDLSGFSERQWTEQNRKEAEQQMASVLGRAKEIDHEGKMPVVFHSAHHAVANMYDKKVDDENRQLLADELKERANTYLEQAKNLKKQGDEIRSQQFEQAAKATQKEAKEYEEEKRHVIHRMGIVNQDSGEMTQVEFRKRKVFDESTGGFKLEIFEPMTQVRSMNANQWEDERTKLLEYQKKINEVNDRLGTQYSTLKEIEEKKGRDSEEYKRFANEFNRDQNLAKNFTEALQKDMGSQEMAMSDKFDKWASDLQKEEFKETSKNTIQQLKNMSEVKKQLYEHMYKAKKPEEKEIIRHQIMQVDNDIHKAKAEVISNMPAPKIWRPVEEFAQEKFAETVSNALLTYARENKDIKFERSPIVAIENFMPPLAMSSGKNLRAGIERTRKEFSKKLAATPEFKKQFSNPEKEASKIAEKVIGATWDMGHINLLRKSGYSEEELKKRVLEETQAVADVVKHIHITDNFGFTDAHLPPGMGNVQIEEIMNTIKNRKGGFEGRGIVEAGNFVAEFGVDPTHSVMEFFGSPVYYEMGEDNIQKLSRPYWIPESPNFYRDSFVEYPSQHFSLYGSSFSSLPKTFGGQMGGDSSRFSNTPNQ